MKPAKKGAYRLSKPEKREFYRELMALAVPIGAQNLLTALVGATDALMLGRFSQDAVSAVSLANQISFIMSLFLAAVLGGGGALIAQYAGKGDRKMVKNLLCMTIKWSIGISGVFFCAAMFLPGRLMRIYTPDAGLIAIGASYLRAVAPSYLFNAVTQCYYLVMKIEGKAAQTVKISVVTLIADMVIDFFLIYGIAGVPRLGADGSAYSTVAVELVALVWCVAEYHRGDSLRPDLEGMKWHSARITKDWLAVALPTLGSALAWGLSITMNSLMMGHLGSDATAAASISATLLEVVTCVCKGVSSGTGIILGKLLGQDLFDKARAYGRKFCHISLWVGLVHTVLLAIIGPIVAHFFLLTDTARSYLTYMLIFTGVYVFAYSVNTIVTCGVFPAGGDARYDAISVMVATWCFSMPLSLLGTFVFHWPVMLIYVVMRLDEIVKAPFIYPRYRKFLWLKNLTREE